MIKIAQLKDIPYPLFAEEIKFEGTVIKIFNNGDTTRNRPMKFQVLLENKEKLIAISWNFELLELLKNAQLDKTVYLFTGKSGYFGKEEQSIRIEQITPTKKTSSVKTVAFDNEINTIKPIIQNLIKTYVKNPNYLKLLDNLLSANFYIWQAAKVNHHDFKSGLAVHSYNVAMNALNLYDIYSEYIKINQELLVTAALLHDIGKLREYTSIGDFTEIGQLQGHIVLGIELIQDACQKCNINPNDSDIVKLMHVILAHHGKLEFGSPVKPLIPEAYIINYADDVDSKMTAIAETYNNLNDGEYSQELMSIGGKLFKI